MLFGCLKSSTDGNRWESHKVGEPAASEDAGMSLSPHVRDVAMLFPQWYRPPPHFCEDQILKRDNVHKEGPRLLCAEKGRGAAN